MAGQTLKIWTLVTVLWCGTLQGTDSQAFTLNIPVETVYPELVPLYTRNSMGDNYVYTFHFSNDWATKFFKYFCNESQRDSRTVSRDRLTQSVKVIRQPYAHSRCDSDGVAYCYVGNDTMACCRLNVVRRGIYSDFAENQCQETSIDVKGAESCKAIHILWDERHFDHLYKNDILFYGVVKPNVYNRQRCITLKRVTQNTADPASTVSPTTTTTYKDTSTKDDQDIPYQSTVKTTLPDAEISTWITSSPIPQHETTATTTESAGDATSSTIPTITEQCMTCAQMYNVRMIWQLQKLIESRMSQIDQYVKEICGWQLDKQTCLRLIPGLTEYDQYVKEISGLQLAIQNRLRHPSLTESDQYVKKISGWQLDIQNRLRLIKWSY